MNQRPARAAWRRLLYLNRRTLAVLCAFLAVLAALAALSPERAGGVIVIAAADDLPAGTVLAATHRTDIELPADAVPDGAARAASDVEGRILGAPVTRRTPLTTASVASGERLARPGFVVVALPLPDDALAPLVKPGTRLDLMDSSGSLVASEVRVVAAPDAAAGLGLGASSRAALIEVQPEVAMRIAAEHSGRLTVAVR